MCKQKDNIILAIDHGNRTGWSIIRNGIVTNTGFIEFKNNVQYFKNISELIMLFKPSLVGLEEPKHLRNAKVTQHLIELYSILKLSSNLNGCKVVEVNPKSYKKFVTSNGNAEKEIVLESLLSKYKVEKGLIYKPVYYKNKNKGIKSVFFDESDATAIAIYVYNKYNK